MVGSPRLSYHHGDHVCTLFTTLEEQLRAAVEYIRAGLKRGDRCLYVCGERTLDDFRAALTQAGIAVEQEEARGALVLLTKHTGHLTGGSFDPDRMIQLLEKAVQDSLADGFAGLSAAGDMNWVLDNAPGTEKLAEYESRLNRFYQSHRALGLCQYNLGTLPPKTVEDCLCTHPYVRVDGPLLLENPFCNMSTKSKLHVRKAQRGHRKVARRHSAPSATRAKMA